MIKTESVYFILFIATLIQAILIYSCAVTLHYELKTSGLDGTIFEQILTNIINGHGFVTTLPPPFFEQNWLGFHFSPILLIITPVYWLFPHTETLLLIHCIFLAIAAIPIFFACKILLKSEWQALAISLFYLLNPFVINAGIWDFHEIAFAPLVLSLILLSIIAKERGFLIFFCIILVTIKEHYGLAVFGSGLLWAWHWREPKFGLVVASAGLISFLLIIKIIMPHFSPIGGAAMLTANSELDYFSWVSHPFADIDLLTRHIMEAVFYIILLLTPLWFQPLFNLAWLFPAFADGTINILSNNDMLRHPSSYHSAAIIPVLLIAYARAISMRYSNTTKIKTWEMLGITALMTGFFTYNFASLPNFPNNLWELSTPHFALSAEDNFSRNEIIRIIGDKSAISAQSNILPHLPIREQMYTFPHGTQEAEYVILNISTPFKKKSNAFGVPYFDKYADIYFSAVFNILNDKNWGIVYYQNKWLVLKRGGENNPQAHNLAENNLRKLQLKVEELDKRKLTITP